VGILTFAITSVLCSSGVGFFFTAPSGLSPFLIALHPRLTPRPFDFALELVLALLGLGLSKIFLTQAGVI
jgi:hypothetical protein